MDTEGEGRAKQAGEAVCAGRYGAVTMAVGDGADLERAAARHSPAAPRVPRAHPYALHTAAILSHLELELGRSSPSLDGALKAGEWT